MAQKKLMIAGVGEVVIQKRKGSRNVRLTIGHEGQLRVSIPNWSPYKVGEAFILSKTDWIKKQRTTKLRHIFQDNSRIGKGHRLRIIAEPRGNVTARVGKADIIIRIPAGQKPDDGKVQEAIKKAAVRALKQEAALLLPRRISALAEKYGFTYRSVSVKHLKTRWGSCSSHKDIVLNCYLVQLPWDLIDYVILHELLHTRIMAHGKPFWDELSLYVPNLQARRVAIRAHHPALIPAI